MASATADQPSLYGQPTGLYMLFFAEMWERFSYYGMRALLVLYITKGFLGLNDGDAYKIYGAYAAMVYMTPFFGGLIAPVFLVERDIVVTVTINIDRDRVPDLGTKAVTAANAPVELEKV